MMKRSLLIAIGMTVALISNAQNVGINNNGAAPNANAILDVDVTTNNKGILIPRLTTAQRTAIGGLGAGDEGLTVYDETTNSYWLWDGTQWVEFSMGGAGWLINGNANTTAGTNFLGTTNAQAVDFRTNNTTRFRIANGNQVQANADGTQALPFYTWVQDPNTGMWRSNADELAFSAGGVEFMVMDANGADQLVVNENSVDMNFRVESNGNANMLFVDGGNNEVGIGKVPTEALDVNGNLRFSGALMPNNQAGTASQTLLSAGAGLAPTWSTFTFLNTPAIANIGKYYSSLSWTGTWLNNTTLVFTINDPNLVCGTHVSQVAVNFTCSTNQLITNGMAINNIRVAAGSMRISVTNFSGYNITGAIPIVYTAFY